MVAAPGKPPALAKLAALGAAVALWCAGCAGSGSAGDPARTTAASPGSAGVRSVTTGPAPGSADPTSNPSSNPSSNPTSGAAAALCATARGAEQLTSCLSGSISAFWTATLHSKIAEPVVLHPTSSAVPARCRKGLSLAPAFTCPVDRKLYFTDAFLARLQRIYPSAASTYAFAVVLSHEMGHVLQLHVRQPQIEQANPDPNTIRFVEQQADCLSGVWAHAQAAAGTLNPAMFRQVALQVLTSISTSSEVSTHGTPGQRVAAIDRGLQGGVPKACQLKGSA